MEECCGQIAQRDKLWSVAILDNNSVYFTAVDRVLTALGWPIVRITIESGSIAAVIEQVREYDPELIMVGSWHCSKPDSPLVRQLLNESLRGSLLVVHDGDDPSDGRVLGERIRCHDSLIECTTAALDSFLRTAGVNSAVVCIQ